MMDPFLKMDIFFVVATAAAVVVAAALTYALWRLGRVFEAIERITDGVAEETERVREDIAHLRQDIQNGTGKIEAAFDFLGALGKRTKPRRRLAKKTNRSNS